MLVPRWLVYAVVLLMLGLALLAAYPWAKRVAARDNPSSTDSIRPPLEVADGESAEAAVWPDPLDAHDEEACLLYPFFDEVRPSSAGTTAGQPSRAFDGTLVDQGWTLTAPAEVHQQLAALYRDSAELKKLQASRSLQQQQSALEAAARRRQSRFTMLLGRIKQLEQQVAESKKKLVDLEVERQLAVETYSRRRPEQHVLEQDIAADKNVVALQERIQSLEQQIRSRQIASRLPQDVRFKQLQREAEQAKTELAERRQDAEKQAIEKWLQQRRQKLQEAMARHAVAHQAAVEQLRELQEELEQAQRQLMENEYQIRHSAAVDGVLAV